jgi:hypothetical protein
MKAIGFALVAALTVSAGAAQAYSAINGFTVNRLSNGNFAVMNRGGLSAANAWCAAGDYVMSVLGVHPSTLVWRISEPPRPRGANIEFSLSSAGAASSTGIATLGGNGSASMVAVSARNMCLGLNAPGFRR